MGHTQLSDLGPCRKTRLGGHLPRWHDPACLHQHGLSNTLPAAWPARDTPFNSSLHKRQPALTAHWQGFRPCLSACALLQYETYDMACNCKFEFPLLHSNYTTATCAQLRTLLQVYTKYNTFQLATKSFAIGSEQRPTMLC